MTSLRTSYVVIPDAVEDEILTTRRYDAIKNDLLHLREIFARGHSDTDGTHLRHRIQAKAWLQGAGGTNNPTILSSTNVDSVTYDGGTGDYNIALNAAVTNIGAPFFQLYGGLGRQFVYFEWPMTGSNLKFHLIDDSVTAIAFDTTHYISVAVF